MKMMRRHRKHVDVTQLLLLITFCTIFQYYGIVLCAAPAPLDYLAPPPLPASAAHPSQPTHFKPARPSNNLGTESRTVPLYALNNGQTVTKTPSDPGFISRVARWFGFANQEHIADQQTSAANANNHAAYHYPRPQQQGSGNKEPCNLCNKYPWVPMMHNSVHYPWDLTKLKQGQSAGYTRNQPANIPLPVAQLQHAASSVKQRAVQFNYPLLPPAAAASTAQGQYVGGGAPQYSSGPFIPMTIPNLNNLAQLPIYNAKPFRESNSLQPAQSPYRPSSPVTDLPLAQQQLPSTEAAHFNDGIASAQSELNLDSVIPTQIPPSTGDRDASFEIVKSHQLTDYVSSVEYPATFVQTQSFDITSSSTAVPTNHQPDLQPVISTGRYQYSTLSPYLSQHIPASQILTEPGNFVAESHYSPQQSTLPAEYYEQSTIQDSGHDQAFDNYDNYASASVQNSSIVGNVNYDTWTLETNNYEYATTTPEEYSNTDVETTTKSDPYHSTTKSEPYHTIPTEASNDNDVEFIASVQTSNQNNNGQQSTRLWPTKTRGRDTPKRLLDAPIQHISGNLGVPRPFTRDPSKLDLRVVAKNHKTLEEVSSQQSTQTLSPASPTPTSTYSSLDASGQFAGMSPPAMPTQAHKNHFIQFTTKIQPRPFEPTRNDLTTQASTKPGFSSWVKAQNADLHTPAETMLVNVKSALNSQTPSKSRTNAKYLTKILASNLRELLQKEHASSPKLKNSPNALSIDLHALQKNIDDWTEQEYTSLSHRPSTPTILGRSKHIPKEFLPSTTITSTSSAIVKPQRQSKTTKGFLDASELPASVNSLEPLYERASTKRFQYTAINDNHIQDIYDSQEMIKYTTTTPQTPISVTPTTSSSTTTTTTTGRPLYHIDMIDQEPEELWRKAKVSISPKTKEKVYVVTPQPVFFPQRQIPATSTTERPFDGLGSAFKSPRFLVRPTPGNGTNEGSPRHKFDSSQEHYSSSSFFIPDQLGLRGLSAYVPSQPVEIIDGNSKVLKIVKSPKNLETTTSPQNIMDLTKEKFVNSKKKTKIEPSPR
ncbi:uncharacterized protein LOC142228051 isoform X2 [Haematobia irritans]|uniref:uncharacterized protein LOC142228051 isoform X2 n=1 Tax=Haematobia irritans TaxID=7368 RepID=UPI003F4FAE99